MQLNVIRLKMDERIQVREEALCRAIIDNMLLQRIEGVNRGMFCLQSTRKCIRDDPVMVEAELLRLMMCLQVINNQYRVDLRQLYDISEELEDDLLNNKIYGCLTDGRTWIFIAYEHAFGRVQTNLIQQLEIDEKAYFASLHEVVKLTVNLCADIIFNKCQKN